MYDKGFPNSGGHRKTGTTPMAVPISPASTTHTAGFAFATDTAGDITTDEITLLRGSYFAVSWNALKLIYARELDVAFPLFPSFFSSFPPPHTTVTDADESFWRVNPTLLLRLRTRSERQSRRGRWRIRENERGWKRKGDWDFSYGTREGGRWGGI